MLGMIPMTGANAAADTSLMAIITSLGLTSNLKLVLDAGDANSYTSGQKWLDTSGNGYDFFLGSTSASQSSDPTFNGTPGGLSSSEYFSGDGGDYFTYDTTIETWMQNLGKSGNSFTFFGHARIASDSDTDIVATRGNTIGEYGMGLHYSATNNKLLYRFVTASDTLAGLGGAGPDITPAQNVSFGFAVTLDNGNDYTVNIGGTNYSASITGQTFKDQNSTDNMRLMALGDASTIAPSGTRLYDLAIWSTKLSDANLISLYNAMFSRYGF